MAKGMSGMMKQVQKMQKKMMELQGELEQERVEGTAGGGMVTVVANGRQDILEMSLTPMMWRCLKTWSWRRSTKPSREPRK
jgi:DNA-binding protein YbaB